MNRNVDVERMNRTAEVIITADPSERISQKELILHKYVLDTIPEIDSESSSISDAIQELLNPMCKMYGDVEC